jgi:hypothetical protein
MLYNTNQKMSRQLEGVFQARHRDGNAVVDGPDDGATVAKDGFQVFFSVHKGAHEWRQAATSARRECRPPHPGTHDPGIQS